MYAKPGSKSLRARLADGERLIGTWAGLQSLAAIELFAELSFDFVILDLQHGELGIEDILRFAPAFRCSSAAPVVRMLDQSSANIGRVLDFGMENIIIPTVNTAAQAARCVEAISYPPGGVRSYGAFRSGHYGLREASIAHNADRMMGVQIETAEAFENLDAILETPNLGLAFVGPYDLRISRGIPTFDLLEPTVKTIIERCRVHGVPFGTMAITLEDGKRWLDLGAQFVSIGVDQTILREGVMAIESAVSPYRSTLAGARK